MTRTFWVIAAGWIIGVIGAAPSAFEQMQRRGAGIVIPGMSLMASEVIIAAALALIPPLLAAAVIRNRRKGR